MNFLSVSGPTMLQGSVVISGAKNSVLPILAATLLCGEKCVIHNCPRIDDVENTLSILRDLGASVCRKGHTVTVDTANADGFSVSPEDAAKMRSSVLFLGALLGRFGVAKLAMPGGCPLGARPIDMHLAALSSLGVQLLIQKNRLYARAVNPGARTVVLPFPSVGATENVILFSLSVPGTVTVKNAALEPEIVDLVRFLRSAGAEISGEGSDTILIRGGAPLHGCTHTVMPDRMEAATYLCACAGCGGSVLLQNANAADLLPVIEVLRNSGCEIDAAANEISISSDGRLQMPRLVRTAPYPGFPTDAQAIVTAAMLRAKGNGTVEDTVFKNRFAHVPELRKTGAEIVQAGNLIALTGVRDLHAATLTATDLRAAAALLIAAMQAEGESRIFGVQHLRRGYETPEEKLKNLGADVKYVEIPTKIVYNTI